MIPPAFFHEDSATVRFWIEIDGRPIGGSISKSALQYRFRAGDAGSNPLETYQAHLGEIEAAMRRRVAQGSIEPVMLREFDLRAPAA